MNDQTSPVAIALYGATGRMGHSLIRAIHESTDYALATAVASAGSPVLGTDAGTSAGLATPLGIALTADASVGLSGADVAVDFSVAGAVPAHLAACVQAGVGIVIGTTGLTPEDLVAVEEASAHIPVLVAANTSLGVNLIAQLIEKAAASLPRDYDIEVFEAHHRYKVDAPSGTALQLGAAAARGRGETLGPVQTDRRGARSAGSIGFSVLRGGDIVGEHTVYFAGPGERIEITHRAHDRMTFAYGALRAAAWLAARAPGRYSMADVLELR
jgi:4-hydroxy-tetrahydrodipicolinate reductase